MIKQHKTSFALATLSLILAACAHVPSPNIYSVDDVHAFEVKGKLGIRSPENAKALNFNWEHKDNTYDIKLHGTLGFGSARIHNKNGIVELQTRDGKQQSDNAESLLASNTGIELPIQALKSWILGKASPDMKIAQQSYYPSGKIERLSQQRWNIHFKQYEEVGNISLPQKIVATHDGIRLTIAIKSWKI